MPDIIGKENYKAWLDPKTEITEVQKLLFPYPSEQMEFYPVSIIVNSPTNDASECIQPVKLEESK
ncbi:MAG: hypothetical protein JWQ35_1307 [Bacteriovoracaceae bacterium]|nr:hypothetical protein [Bacteriovoracaceae bacterium]